MTKYSLYEPGSGIRHLVEVVYNNGCYNLLVDGEFFSTHESRRDAEEEMVDVVNDAGWSAIKPFA